MGCGDARLTASTTTGGRPTRPVLLWSDDDDHRDGTGGDGRGGCRGRSEDPRQGARRPRLARNRADADRRDRRRAQARSGDVRVDGGRREIDAHPEAVQARRARMAQGEHGDRRGRRADRRQDGAGDRRPVLGRNASADARRGRRRARRRRAADARRRVQAAHVALCVPGQRASKD